VVETTNSGVSWTNVNGQSFYGGGTNILHPDQHALAFTSTGDVLIGDDGGIYEYNESTVSNLNTNLDTGQFYADLGVYNDGAQILGGLQDNGSALDTGTIGWPEVLAGDGGYSAINPLDTTQQFGEGDSGLYVTGDGWQSDAIFNITPFTAGSNFVPPMVMVPNTGVGQQASPTVYYGGDNLYVSTDPTADTWTQLTSHIGSDVSAIVVAPSDPDDVYVGFDDGTTMVSNNATSASPTFTDISPGVGQWVTHIDVDPTNPGSIAVSFSDSNTQSLSVSPMVETGNVSLTGTPSATWSNVTGNLPTGVASNAVVFDQGSLVVATDVGIFSTSAPNEGSTIWTTAGTGLPNVQVLGLSVDASGDLYAATHGRGVWKLVP